MKIHANKYKGEYFFSEFNSNYCNFTKCEMCHFINIDKEYQYIISKLVLRRLLPDDFPFICCPCWNIVAITGLTECPECGGVLDIGYHGKFILITCRTCEFSQEKEFVDVEDIAANYEYNPTEVLIKKFCSGE